MSEALHIKVDQKRVIIAEEEAKVTELRSELLKIKTDNVKKVLQIENIETKKRNQKDKENTETRKTNWKLKTEYSRGFHTNFISH